MATGKPVRGTQAGGIPEIVLENKTGLLVPPHNASMLANAMIKLVSNREALELMGKAGRRRAEECYSIVRWRQDILSLFTTA
jgi:glycosyltransferase involved in cell wall biosynthesis